MIESGSNVYIGIDPGKSGAIACVSADYRQSEVHDYPGDVNALAGLVRGLCANLKIRGACIEAVHAMPKQGVSSMFAFGANFGGSQGILAALEIPYILVTPQRWQKTLDSGADTKTRSLEAARRLFPGLELHLKKHDGRADALHLARWAIDYWRAGK